MINAFVLGAAVVQFPANPLRDSSEIPELIQAQGLDSAGNAYVYDKGGIFRVTHRLVFSQVSGTLLSQLYGFSDNSSRGSKNEFTWYDHVAAAHTVRLDGDIGVTRTGPDRYRIELALVEELPWSFPAATTWAEAMAARTGAAPVWLLKLTLDGTDYYLSDQTCEITPWGVTAFPWVASFGAVRGGVTNGLSEYQAQNLTVDLLSDANAAPNMEALASYPLEQSPASLYLWFKGAVDAPLEMFRGYVDDVSLPDETRLSITIEDESSRLDAYVGTKVDRVMFASADPDDVGKVIPIIVGTVSKFPTLAVDAGIMTSLPSGVTAVATTFPVSDATGLAAGMTVQVDDEKMLIGSIAGSTLTVTRGRNGTLAAVHSKGATLWQVKTAFAYLVADHALDTLPKVYGKVGEALLDVTAVVSRYLGSGTSATVGAGQLGGQHPSYPGRACVTVPGYITVSQAVSLALTDGIGVDKGTLLAALSGIVGLNGSVTLAGLIALLGSLQDYGITDPGHNHTGNQTTLTQYGTTPSFSGNSPSISMTTGFPSLGAQVQSSYTVTVRVTSIQGSTWPHIYIGGADMGAVSSATRTWTATSGDVVGVDINGGSNVLAAAITTSQRDYTYIPQVGTGLTGNTKTLANNGTLSASNNTLGANNGTLAATNNTLSTGLSGNVTKSGTVTLSGNSVANTLVGDQLLVDCGRAVTLPGEVTALLLATYGNIASFSQIGTFPASYALNGAITEYKTLRQWLNIIAFQCRAWFRMDRGIGYLIVRPDTLTSIRTISACRITDDGRRVHSRKKAQRDDIINTINLLYDRNWTQSGDTAYQQVSKGTDDASIGIFGVKERPELFRGDFITTQAMADSVRDYWLTHQADRPWLHEFECYLDQADLLFGQGVTLAFAGNVRAQIIDIGPVPGSGAAMDAVRMVAWSATLDATAPVVAFALPAGCNSLTIPVTAFTATDNVGVTGYMVTTSATPPLVSDPGWTSTPPATVTAPGAGNVTFYAWAKDRTGNVSDPTPATVLVDITAPVVSAFTMPGTATSSPIPVTTFTATDNVGVTGYMITISAPPPAANAAGWTATPPATVTAPGSGSTTFYAWAKDAAGNVSSAATATVVITDVAAPVVTAFTLPASATSLTVPVTTFTATDNFGVTGYMVTTSATTPTAGAAGWTATPPATVTAPGSGSTTFYAWAKDSAGNVSAARSATVVITDVAAPTVTAFTLPANSNSLTVPVTTLTATDNFGVTGYMITTSATPPSAGGAGWTSTPPTSATALAQGSIIFYAWAKDAAGNVSASASALVDIDIGGIVIAHVSSPSVSAYPWSAVSGFGVKYADPTTLPTGNSNNVAFSPASDAIAVAHSSSPYVSAYSWYDGSGFGVKYANPTTLPAGIGRGIAFSPAGDAIAVAHDSSPYVSAYPWSAVSGFGVKYADPATLPASNGRGVAFSPAGDAIAVAHDSSPCVSAYPWSAVSGFGVKYANPATLPAGSGTSVAFSPAGNAVAVAHWTAPFVSAYPWSAISGFGVKYANPATLPAGTGHSVVFTPAGDAIAVAHDSSPYVSAYHWSAVSGFGVKYANPATLPASNGESVAFTPAGNAIAVAHQSPPRVSAYSWSAVSGFGVKYADPATLPTSNGYGVAFR